jgi:hypothetical protein
MARPKSNPNVRARTFQKEDAGAKEGQSEDKQQAFLKMVAFVVVSLGIMYAGIPVISRLIENPSQLKGFTTPVPI